MKSRKRMKSDKLFLALILSAVAEVAVAAGHLEFIMTEVTKVRDIFGGNNKK